MKLSSHFDLSEFTRSQYAARHGIDMTPPEHIVTNLRRLCVEVLEPLREAIGGPLIITSGYRPLTVNRAVGGSLNSDHMDGRAADFHALNLDLASTARVVRHRAQTLPIAKAIMEFGSWIHVAVTPEHEAPARAFYVAMLENGKTIYRPWEAV